MRLIFGFSSYILCVIKARAYMRAMRVHPKKGRRIDGWHNRHVAESNHRKRLRASLFFF